jgi:hypothetical protein
MRSSEKELSFYGLRLEKLLHWNSLHHFLYFCRAFFFIKIIRISPFNNAQYPEFFICSIYTSTWFFHITNHSIINASFFNQLSFRALSAVGRVLRQFILKIYSKWLILEKRFPIIHISPAFLHESSPIFIFWSCNI